MILSVVLIIIGAGFIILALLLFLPAGLFIRLEKNGSPLRLRASFAPFSGFLGLGYEQQAAKRFFILSTLGKDLIRHRIIKKPKPPEKKRGKPKPVKEEKPKQRLSERIKRVGALVTELYDPFMRTLRGVLRSLRIRESEVEFTYGTGNAMLTGKLYGVFLVLNRMLPEKVTINARPDFTSAGFTGSIYVKGDILIWRLLIGLFPMGKAVIVHYLREWRRKRAKKHQPTKITSTA